ncbi:DUF4173 domain-containing protein [Paenibacillus sp. HB172176]|uniref:DUF4153 domain-containing protein n=1 Tax=Paenibacillus sp. HB172176 TaxID=2493690 RepID=UPI00143A1302|nr:DUF4173 domain-containing protein [Paenibacillus sp. HB172176]
MQDAAPWQKRYDRMLVYSLLIGLAGQYLFVGREFGVSVPLFIACFYGLFFYAVQGRIGGFDRWKGQQLSGILLFIPIALLSLTYVFYRNDFFHHFNVLLLILLVVAQTLLLTRSGSQPWHRLVFYGELLLQWLFMPLTHLMVPFSLAGNWLRPGGGNSGARSNLRQVGFGLLIAAPLLFVVVSLLSSADGIFQGWLNHIPQGIYSAWAGKTLVRLIVGGGIALYLFCYLWSLLFRKSLKPAAGAALQPYREKALLDSIAASTALILVNVVYILFTAIQFTYLFGGADGLLPEGVSYAEYTHRGFAELVLVAMINLGILMVGLHYIRSASPLQERLRKLLLSVLMGCTIVMLISAYSRLSLYEEAYGYTLLRLLVQGFMLLLGVWISVSLVRIWTYRFSLAKFYISSAIVAYVIMNYANLDARIAEGNLDRYEHTGEIDVYYLGTLSTDALPAIKQMEKRFPELEGVDDIISQMRKEAAAKKHWQSWNLSLRQAKE